MSWWTNDATLTSRVQTFYYHSSFQNNIKTLYRAEKHTQKVCIYSCSCYCECIWSNTYMNGLHTSLNNLLKPCSVYLLFSISRLSATSYVSVYIQWNEKKASFYLISGSDFLSLTGPLRNLFRQRKKIWINSDILYCRKSLPWTPQPKHVHQFNLRRLTFLFFIIWKSKSSAFQEIKAWIDSLHAK